MGKVINLDEYKSFRRRYRFIKPEAIKTAIEKNRIGDFFGKTDEEVQKFYEDLSDKLNDMVERPCGETAFEVGCFLSEYKINPKDFDTIFDMIKVSSKEIIDTGKSDNSNIQEVSDELEERNKRL